MTKQKKQFGIYHWDTFDNVTLLIDEADTLEQAQNKVHTRYRDRISQGGADRVDIVDFNGNVVGRYSVR